MVRFLVKRGGSGESGEFLYDCDLDQDMVTVYRDIRAICNTRVWIRELCHEIDRLTNHGPALPPEMQGLAPGQAEELGLTDEVGERMCRDWGSNPDPVGRRCGKQMPGDIAGPVREAVQRAREEIDKGLVESGIPLTVSKMAAVVTSLRDTILEAMPTGIPDYDPAYIEVREVNDLLEGNDPEVWSSMAKFSEMYIGDVELWFCSRPLPRSGSVSTALKTNNEKTRVTVKITVAGQGPPAKEPAISESEQAKLLAYYRRKQEALEVLQILTEVRENYLGIFFTA